MDKPIVVRPV
jgi:hypothetical protein